MDNFVQKGVNLDYTNSTGSAISSGDPVLIGVRIGIAETDIANGYSGSILVEGVVTVTKKTADSVSQGALLYWDANNEYFTTTAGGNTQAGYATTSSASGVTTVNLKLNA